MWKKYSSDTNCPICNSKIQRPEWTIDSEYIRRSPPFSVHVNTYFGNKDKRIITLKKLVPGEEEEIQWCKVDINNPEDMQKIMNAIKRLYPKTKWKEESVLLSELSAEPQNKEKLKQILEQYPDVLNRILNFVEKEGLKEKDIDYLFKTVENLNNAILKAGGEIKNSFEDLLGQLSNQGNKAIKRLGELLKKWHLLQVTSTSTILLNRLNFLDSFDQLIHDDAVYEIKGDGSIHNSLENNFWILGEEYWLVQSNRALKNFIIDELEDDDKKYENIRPDFVCVDYGEKRIIAEIKRPSHTLKKEDLDQIQDYKYMAQKYSNDNKKIGCFLIGNKISNKAKQLAKDITTVDIKTYTDILQSARNRYREYLEEFEAVRSQLDE